MNKSVLITGTSSGTGLYLLPWILSLGYEAIRNNYLSEVV